MGRPRKFTDRVTFSFAMERPERERLRDIALNASSHSRKKVSSSAVAREALARHIYRLLEDARARRQPRKPPPREWPPPLPPTPKASSVPLKAKRRVTSEGKAGPGQEGNAAA